MKKLQKTTLTDSFAGLASLVFFVSGEEEEWGDGGQKYFYTNVGLYRLLLPALTHFINTDDLYSSPTRFGAF